MPKPLSSDEIERLGAALADSSDRVSRSRYGTTASGRDLWLLTISSPSNLARIEAIRAGLRELAETADSERAEEIIATVPAMVWFGCGIHGDEISGGDAAVEAMRQLAEASDPRTLEWLDNLVIHVDANANPEGRERYLAHIDAFRRSQAASDPQDVLHNPFWPGGRGNHYFFDLNRDAIYAVQQQSRARVAAILAASPQLYIDAHEMGAGDTYLFAVPAEPLNPHLPPSVHDSWRDFAQDHAEAFDADGTSFYTRSWNEVFYPGFFDIWPAYLGAVPILYEQAATAGTSVELPNGRQRSYHDAVGNQLRSLAANLSTAARMKNELLRRWWRAQRAFTRIEEGAPVAWLIPPPDAFKLQNILRVLRTQGIRVESLAESIEVAGLRSVWTAEASTAVLPGGTLKVSCAQPRAALIRNIFDFDVPLPAAFAERERRGLDFGTRTLLFDVTAWSLPLAFGIDCFWTSSAPPGDWRGHAPSESPLGGRELSPRAGSELPPSAGRALRRPRYGFLLRDPSLCVTARALASGLKLRVAREPFLHAGREHAPGTILLRHDDQALDPLPILEQQGADADTEIIELDSARIHEGPDLGGPEFALLQSPSIAILTGPGFAAPGTGALWHLFDEVVGLPVALLEAARLGDIDLARYNVLIVGEVADARRLRSMLATPELDVLRHWIHTGGTLIAVSTGAHLLAEAGFTACRTRAQVADRGSSSPIGDRSGGSPTGVSPGDPSRKYLPRGAYLRAEFNTPHWLRYGVADRLPVLFREADALVAAGSAETIGRFATAPTLALSGLVWPEAVRYIAETGYLVREKMGRGQIVSFACDPVFRGYSLGTQRLLLNAAILGPGLRTL